MAIGVPYELFWKLNPHTLKPFTEAHKIKRKILDEQMWTLGIYVQRAVSVAVEHNLAGKKAQSKYFEEPIMMQEQTSEQPKTEVDKEERKRKAEMFFMALEAKKANFEINHPKDRV